MVYGLNTFRERFRAFTENYVIIGGTACDQMLSKTAISPRATEGNCYPSRALIRSFLP